MDNIHELLGQARCCGVTGSASEEGGAYSINVTSGSLLLNDEEDLVRKGYGWLLKVASIKYPKEVFSYVMDRRERMPKVALRYAIEKLPKQLQRQAMGHLGWRIGG